MEWIFPKSFYKARITVVVRPHKDRKTRLVSLMNTDVKNNHKSKQVMYKKNYILIKSEGNEWFTFQCGPLPCFTPSLSHWGQLLVKVKVTKSSPTLWNPMDYINPWNSPGKNTGVGSLSLLQGNFPTQGLKPGLPHCRRILYQLSHKGSPE